MTRLKIGLAFTFALLAAERTGSAETIDYDWGPGNPMGWVDLVNPPNDVILGDEMAPTVIAHGPENRFLDVFARSNDLSMWNSQFDPASGAWSPWTVISAPNDLQSSVTAVTPNEAEIMVFGVNGNNDMEFATEFQGFGFSNFALLPTPNNPKFDPMSTPKAITTFGGNYINLVAVGINHQLFFTFYNGANWATWVQLPGAYSAGGVVSLAADPTNNGRLFLAAHSAQADQEMLQATFVIGPGWGTVAPTPGPIVCGTDPSVASYFDLGTNTVMVDYVCVDSNHVLNETRQNLSQGTFTPWTTIFAAQQFQFAPTVVSPGPSLLDVYASDASLAGVTHGAWNGSGGWINEDLVAIPQGSSSPPAVAVAGASRRFNVLVKH